MATEESESTSADVEEMMRAVEDGEPLQEMMEVDGIIVDAAIQQAFSFYEKERYEKASTLAEGASALDVTRFSPHLLLGDIHMRRGELEEAVDRLDRALNIQPDSPQAKLKLAEANIRRDKIAGAKANLQDILDREELADSVRNRAEVLSDQIG